MSRPELTGHAALFYNQKEARKYDSSSRMMGVQREITERAIELLRLDHSVPSLVLDIGCGSGLSGKVLEEYGHVWVGCDVSRDMLHVAKERMLRNHDDDSDENSRNDSEEEEQDDEDDDKDIKMKSTTTSAGTANGDLLQHDMGSGLPFRPATFDACISISALQWLCYSNSKDQNPKQRLTRFFSSLYTVLKRGGRAVLQFYPETAEQAVLITETATRVGFAGGVVVDYPNSAKAKKHYLVLSFDKGSKQKMMMMAARTNSIGDHASLSSPQQQQQHVSVGAIASAASKKKKPVVVRKNKGVKTKEWILHKKDSQRRKGKDVRPDSKYTARRRPHKF